MDADRPLKELLRLRPRDLLALTGDAGAAFVSTQVAELPSLSRRVDTVLRLRRGRQDYLRHLEFEVKYRKGLELRCFEYATRYTENELAGVVPRETIMASSLWAEARSQGRKEGRQEGAVAEARAFCIELTREHHPELADRLVPLIEACSDTDRLHEWGLQATRLPDTEFLRLVTEQAESTSRAEGRSRTPRPSRRAKAKGSR